MTRLDRTHLPEDHPMTTITITANTSHDRLYDAITNGLENAGIDNYEINDSSSVPASVAPVARDAQELAEVERLRAERDEARDALEQARQALGAYAMGEGEMPARDAQVREPYQRRIAALEELLACYRSGRHPSTALHQRLADTRDALRELAGDVAWAEAIDRRRAAGEAAGDE